MSSDKWLISKSILTDIADAIREQQGSTASIAISQFSTAINQISENYKITAKILTQTISEMIDTSGIYSYIAPRTFRNCVQLSNVQFSNCSIIGSQAFESCTGLVNLSFPACFTIKEEAFYCANIASDIYFPNCEIIESSAFKRLNGVTASKINVSFPNCTELGNNCFDAARINSIELPKCCSIPQAAFYLGSVSFVSLANATFITYNAFQGALLRSMYLPFATQIKSSAFSGCSYLSTLSMIATSYIEASAFYNNTALTEAFLPNLRYVTTGTFSNCTALSKLTLLTYPTISTYMSMSISSTAFTNTPMVNSSYTGKFGSIYVPSTFYNAYYNTFDATLRPRLAMLDGQYDNQYVYGGEYRFSTLQAIPESKANVGAILFGGFYSCKSLTEISLSLCSYIGQHAFNGCINLTSVNLINCKYIDQSAFYTCSKLSTVYCPECTNISNYAFDACYKLYNLDFPKCLSIGTYAFTDLATTAGYNVTVSFPEVRCIGYGAFSNARISIISSTDFIKCRTILGLAFNSCPSLTRVDFPSCLSISQSAFAYCTKLQVANFKECVRIWPYAFTQCWNLSEIYLNKCTAIGSYAFQNCSRLVSLYLNDVSMVPVLDFNAFYGTPIMGNSTYTSDTPHIYVPKSLYSTFFIASYWSQINSNYFVSV